jgi:AcrR family transcriptional regulator
MGVKAEEKPQLGTGAAKTPRTPRGERTLRKILDAAREEFGDRGFSDSSIVGITQRAGVALGTFYTYFDSKEELFKALGELGEVAAVAGEAMQAEQGRPVARAGIVSIVEPEAVADNVITVLVSRDATPISVHEEMPWRQMRLITSAM